MKFTIVLCLLVLTIQYKGKSLFSFLASMKEDNKDTKEAKTLNCIIHPLECCDLTKIQRCEPCHSNRTVLLECCDLTKIQRAR